MDISFPQIIYEDKGFLVINKPSGLIVHAAKVINRKGQIAKGQKGDKRLAICDQPHSTLVDWLVEHYPEIKTVGDDPQIRPGIVHRLDKDTSGVMLVARNQQAFEYFKKLFQEHKIVKTYLAVVSGELKKTSDIIDAPIGILTGSTRRSVRSTKMAKEAVTEYKTIGVRILDSGFKESLLEVHPKTGRTHQIRVHLASIGHPIVGDVLYGPKKQRNKMTSRLMLHALSLEFVALDGKRLQFEAEPPEEFEYSLPLH